MNTVRAMDTELLELHNLTDPDRPITYGVVKPGPEDPSTGIVFIRGGDISNGLIDEDNLRTITQKVSRPYARTILRGGEVVISLVGNPGEVAVVPDRLAGANLARQAGLIALRPEIDAAYIKYYLMSPLGKAELFQRTQGAVQQVINLSDLKRVKVRLPSRQVQEGIADILSAYDDLIENNRRRIALLEEAARLLYREWFVHFRFPAHEHVKITDGLPEGWERRTLGSVLNLQRGFDLPVNRRIVGGVPVYGSTGIVGEHNVAKVDFPTLVTGRSGSLGKVCFVDDPCWPLNTSLWVTEFREVSIHFAYFMLSEMDLAKFNAGASVPTLDRKVAHGVNILVPSRNVANLFDEQMGVVFRQKKLLNQQIQKLDQVRDLLLPRLMNGEITV